MLFFKTLSYHVCEYKGSTNHMCNYEINFGLNSTMCDFDRDCLGYTLNMRIQGIGIFGRVLRSWMGKK